jgi:stage IV sporulation protein FB
MLGIPAETAYDLRFRLLGIPVRVHPLFWIVMAMLGGNLQDLPGILVFVGCGFVSILVHEYGHGLTSRLFGCHPSIVLYGMGGLCSSEADRQAPWQRFLVVLAGPLAGYGLAALTFIVTLLLAIGGIEVSRIGSEIIMTLLFINIVWSTLNLLPIWPLDGGQLSGVILAAVSPANGRRWSHIVSLMVAGILAILTFQYGSRFGIEPMFMTIWFGLFGFANFQILQAMHQNARYE